MTRYILGLLCVPFLLAAERRAERFLGASDVQAEVLYVWSGDELRKLTPGFANLLADIYWLRTVQYFGGQRAFGHEPTYALLYPLADIATTLDPRLEIAYRYGAVFLCESKPLGKGDCEAGLRLLEKGVRSLPESWRVRQDLGYFYYVFQGDAQKGAEVLFQAADLPGAPFWLKTLAAAILTKGGDRHTARRVWQSLYEQGEDDLLRGNAVLNLQRLDGLDAIDALNALAQRFRVATGRPPQSGEQLVALGLDPRRVRDATGVPFEYDAARAGFWFSRGSLLWRRR